MKVTKIGIIGCGNICQAYFNGTAIFKNIEIAAVADIKKEAAQTMAEANTVAALSVDDLLKRKDIDIVVNLTIPKVHAEVSMAILRAGKHVHLEKPLAVSTKEAKPVLEWAKEKGLRVSCAPDTFLGAGLQTCRKIIDDHWIGKPLSGTAFMQGRGPEGWHPNPAFFYQAGGGPMFDMGPYYITALVHLLGPVKALTAVTAKGFDKRISGSGAELAVDIPTHYSGILEFHSGALITMTISFDVQAHQHSNIEIYGTGGSLRVPDPNGFGGNVEVFRKGHDGWKTAPYSHLYAENARSIGVADLAQAIDQGRPHRTSGEMAYHVLEVMETFEQSSNAHGRMELQSTCQQPAALPQCEYKGLL